MKRTWMILAAMLIAASGHAQDQRTVKRDLIRELLSVIDTKAMTQENLDFVFHRLEQPANTEQIKELDEEGRKQYEASMKKYSDSIRQFRERLYARIDYTKYADEVYAPIFDKNFSAGELRELITFYKTPGGQKMARTMADLSIGSMLRASEMMQELGETIRKEMDQEENNAHPWRRTMADLRTVATATEAYATDANKYPDVKSYDELRPILSPTYIRTLPEKDAWGTPFMYVVSADGQHYRFVSAGADKRFDWNATTIEVLPENFAGKAMDSADADIIFQDGQFVQYPAESAKN